MTTTELERLAYITGDTSKTDLYRLILDLERRLGVYEVTLSAIAEGGLDGSMNAHQCAYAAQEVL
jgi:hypothetical protein